MELVPLRVLETLCRKYGEQAALPQQYPGSMMVKDTLAIQFVEAYSTPPRGRTLAALGSRCMAQYGHAIGRQVSLLFAAIVSLHVPGRQPWKTMLLSAPSTSQKPPAGQASHAVAPLLAV